VLTKGNKNALPDGLMPDLRSAQWC